MDADEKDCARAALMRLDQACSNAKATSNHTLQSVNLDVARAEALGAIRRGAYGEAIAMIDECLGTTPGETISLAETPTNS